MGDRAMAIDAIRSNCVGSPQPQELLVPAGDPLFRFFLVVAVAACGFTLDFTANVVPLSSLIKCTVPGCFYRYKMSENFHYFIYPLFACGIFSSWGLKVVKLLN